MSTDSSDGSEIIGNQNTINKSIKNKLYNITTADIEKIIGLPLRREKSPELSISSSSCSNLSDCDSDDNSSLDQEHKEKGQKNYEQQLQEIENHFGYLRNLLYNDPIKEFHDKLVEDKLDSAKEYCQPSQILQRQLKARFEVAAQLKKFKLVNLEHKCESQEQRIKQNYKNETEILYNMIRLDFEEQIDQLEVAWNEVDMDAALWLGRGVKRRERGRHPYNYVRPKIKTPVKTKPRLVYMLKEEEIMEDWIAIKKASRSNNP